MPLKLAFCLFAYRPYGGLQRDFLRIARACQGMGHEIHVFTMEWQGERPAGFHVTIVPMGWRSNRARSRHFARVVREHVDAGGFDCVVGFNRLPGLDVYFAADPCYVARIRRLRGPLYRLTARYRHFAAMERAIFAPGADTRIMVLSEGDMQDFMDLYGTPRERFELLEPGIAGDRRPPRDAGAMRAVVRAELELPVDGMLLLAVGSGFRTKGLDRTLRAIAALPPDLASRTRLLVIGDDRPHSFRRLARRLGIADRVRFLGGRDDVARFYAAADLLVHPAYSEAAGMVILEALVSGLPVLTTDTCGNARHVSAAGGGVVLESPFRQDDLDRALHDMLVSPERERWCRNGLQYGKREDLYNMADKAAAIIVRVAERKS